MRLSSRLAHGSCISGVHYLLQVLINFYRDSGFFSPSLSARRDSKSISFGEFRINPGQELSSNEMEILSRPFRVSLSSRAMEMLIKVLVSFYDWSPSYWFGEKTQLFRDTKNEECRKVVEKLIKKSRWMDRSLIINMAFLSAWRKPTNWKYVFVPLIIKELLSIKESVFTGKGKF